MAVLDVFSRHSSSGGMLGAITRAVLRFFQFVMAITVCALYGIDLKAAHDAGAYTDGRWVYAEVVAGLSAATCLVYGIPFFKSFWTFWWDWVLFILWTALFGIFGKIYIPADPTPHQDGQTRMKNAVWVDLTNMLLWFITAVYATIIFLRGRRSKTLHTGRATV